MAPKPPKYLSPLQCRAARGALNWTSNDLSHYSGVGTTTISRFEKGHAKPIRANLIMLRRTFEEAGIEFIEDHGLSGKHAVPKRDDKDE